MIIAKVVGLAIASLKHERLENSTLLLVRRTDERGQEGGEPFLALDLVGAGEGELVIVSQGSSARMAAGQNSSPVDAAVVGILDSLRLGGTITFRKE